MAVNVAGLISIIIFYLLVLAVGLWAAWRNRDKNKKEDSNEVSIGKRDLGVFLGGFTMTASWVGGGYINGTAESVYDSKFGLLWTVAPFGFSLSLVVAGLGFAKIMREKGYVSMFDPFQLKFGRAVGASLYLPSLLGETMYIGAILSILGSTLFVIVEIDLTVAIIASTAIAVGYTAVGGLYSVAYTDVIQLLFLFVGMWISVPFILTNEAVGNIQETAHVGGWYGPWSWDTFGSWLDMIALSLLGGIPWQVMFQRVFAAKSPEVARTICIVGGLGALPMAIPSVLVGAAAYSTNWTMVGYMNGSSPAELGHQQMILPIVLQYMTPTAVSVIGLGAVSAAVMSSVDAALLSAGSVFTRNIYKTLIRPQASERELVWILRVTVVLVACLSMTFALVVKSVYILFFMAADFIYIILVPQLFSVIYLNPNTYGAICGYLIAVILRLGGGEPFFEWEGVIPYPGGYNFPLKTFVTVISLITINLISLVVEKLFSRGILNEKYDILDCKLAHGGRSIDLEIEEEETPDVIRNECYTDAENETKIL